LIAITVGGRSSGRNINSRGVSSRRLFGSFRKSAVLDVDHGRSSRYHSGIFSVDVGKEPLLLALAVSDDDLNTRNTGLAFILLAVAIHIIKDDALDLATSCVSWHSSR
jgi:hypothetical protein